MHQPVFHLSSVFSEILPYIRLNELLCGNMRQPAPKCGKFPDILVGVAIQKHPEFSLIKLVHGAQKIKEYRDHFRIAVRKINYVRLYKPCFHMKYVTASKETPSVSAISRMLNFFP